MFDFLFSFVEPIIELTEASIFDVIIPREVFFEGMEEERRLPLTIPRLLSEETYRDMLMLRYQQYLGNITFLELLDKYEELLGISQHTT